MQDFKFSEVQEGFSDKLALFDPPKQETAILEHERTRYYPKAAISQGSPVHFFIEGNNGGYIDGANTTMTVSMQIVNDKDEKVKVTDMVTLTNLPLHSIFSQVSVALNGTEVNPDVGTLYGQKEYLRLLLTKTGEFKDTIGRNRGFFKDTAGGTGTTDPASLTNPNNGLNQRHALTQKGDLVTFTGPIGLDFLESCNRYLINGVNISLTFYQSTDAYRLLAADNTKKYKLVLKKMYLSVCSVKLRPEILIRHSQLLADNKSALYAYPRCCMRSQVIPKGSNQFDISQVLSDRVPSLLVLGFVDSLGFSGSLDKNPFNYEHMSCSYASLTINSRIIPARPYAPSFETKDFAEEYAALQSLTGGKGNALSMSDFEKGSSLFVFNVQHHLNLEDGVYPIIHKGNTRLEVRFKTNLRSSIVALMYMVTPGFYSISEARNVTVQY